jgi:tRNA(Ile)-lysidine synthase TilS/MesJ
LERSEEITKSITKRFRKEIWKMFVKGISEYEMIKDGDKIAVCISGGKDSMLMAKCFQEIQKHQKMNFELEFIVMNPGYNEVNKQKIIDNSKILGIPITMFETDIFSRVVNIENNPCYLCARMRRGHLYEKAKELGCNKIALGHHFNDVIETILMGMFYGSQMQTMMPKVCSTSHPGMELIRPLYFVKEDDIIAWSKYNDLEFIQCACKFTEKYALSQNPGEVSKREEMKNLIKEMKKGYDKIDINIFNSVQNVNLDTIISYRRGDEFHHFLDDYDAKLEEKKKE